MRHLRGLCLALSLVAVSSDAWAQRTTRTASAPTAPGGFWELGADAGMIIGLDDPRTLSLSLPIALVRAGYYMSDVMSIEPALRFNSFAGEGFRGFSSYRLDIALLYHFQTDRMKKQTYVRPLISILGSSGGGTTRTGIGVGAGWKWPAMNNRIAWRTEANLTNYLKSGTSDGFTNLSLLFGASVYTK
jgi:hypothetical protein